MFLLGGCAATTLCPGYFKMVFPGLNSNENRAHNIFCGGPKSQREIPATNKFTGLAIAEEGEKDF